MSVENYLPWAFRLVVLGLVAWTAFCILRKVLRRAGIVAYPPFTSRKDYLEAAREMNLEDFIGRAKATPRSLIQKPTVPDLKRKMTSQESIFQTIDSMITNFSRGLEEVVALKKVEAASPVVVKWFRLKESGALVRFSGGAQVGGFRTGEISEGKNRLVTCHQVDLEPAHPKAGEWWRWTREDLGPILGRAVDQKPFIWRANERTGSECVSAVQGGILEPVNFGKGEEQKSEMEIKGEAYSKALDQVEQARRQGPDTFMSKFFSEQQAQQQTQLEQRQLEQRQRDLAAGLLPGAAALRKTFALDQTLTVDTQGSFGNPSGTLDAKLTPLQPNPRWYRVKETGELGHTCEIQHPDGRFCFRGPEKLKPFVHPSDLEPAYPRKGEWWQKRLCPKVHQGQYGTSWISGLVEWKYSTNTADKNHGPEIESALCGCLEPVNYGKGNVNQA